MTYIFIPNKRINLAGGGEKIFAYYFEVDKWHWLLANDRELLWQDTIWKEKEFKDNISTFYRLMSNLKRLEPGVATNLTLGRRGIERWNWSEHLLTIYFSAHREWPHTRQQEKFHLSVEGLFETREAVQSPVHAGSPYAKAHRRKTSQMHGKIDNKNAPH